MKREMSPSEFDLVLSFIEAHPKSAARELELRPPEMAAELFAALPLRQARQIVGRLIPSFAARLITHLSPDLKKNILVDGSAPQIASILRSLDKPQRQDLLSAMPDKQAAFCKLLLSHPEDSVGATMAADIMMLPQDSTAEEALQRLALCETSVNIGVFPVIDDALCLIGTVTLQELLRAKSGTTLVQLKQNVSEVLFSNTSLTAAAEHQGWKQWDNLFVLNRERKLLGILRHADLRYGLKKFEDASDLHQNTQFIGEFGDAYVGVFSAILGLIYSKSTASRF